MTNEEAIAFLEQYINSEVYTEKCISAHEMAITALRSAHAGEPMGYHFPDTTKMVPLTLEQLRRMECPTPVWAEVEGKTIEGWDGYWCLCHRGRVLAPGNIVMYADSVEGVAFYDYPPAHIKGPCQSCGYGGKHLDAPPCTTCPAHPKIPVHIDREVWGDCPVCGKYKAILFRGYRTKEQLMDLSGKIHPPISGGARFCPRCGKPLTPNAWAEPEKRMGVRG